MLLLLLSLLLLLLLLLFIIIIIIIIIITITIIDAIHIETINIQRYAIYDNKGNYIGGKEANLRKNQM